MAITTRAGKGSALTHAELDANFTTLGLAHGDTVANLDVTKMIVNATESGGDPRLHTQGAQYDSVRFMRTGQTGTTPRSTGLFVTEYTDAGHTVGQGTGYWTRIKTTDKESHGGAVMTSFESVTDADNWTARLELRPVKSTGGSEDFSTSVLTVSRDVVVFQNTDRVELQTPLKLHNLYTTEISGLSASSGTLIYNRTNNTFEGWNGSSWVDLGAAGSSSFSGSYNDLTDKPTLFDGAYSSLTGTPTIPSALTDLSITDGTTGQVLTTDGAGNFSFTTVSSGTGGGTAYDQSLNTTDDVTFNSVTTDTLITTGTGISEIESASALTLTTSDGVRIEGGPLRLPTFTTTERNSLVAVDGDVILNTTDNAIQARINGNWVNL